MRTIDADRLIKVIEKAQFEGSGNIMSIINDAPTVDITFKEVVAYECGQKSVERLHGEWVEHYDSSDGFTWLTCSRCMFKAYEEDYNFCPNCGAEMRKEAEE